MRVICDICLPHAGDFSNGKRIRVPRLNRSNITFPKELPDSPIIKCPSSSVGSPRHPWDVLVFLWILAINITIQSECVDSSVAVFRFRIAEKRIIPYGWFPPVSLRGDFANATRIRGGCDVRSGFRQISLREPHELARRPQGLGQLVVTDPQSGTPVRLNLARYHVNVVLHPPVALVQIDQSFYNPFAAQQEGTFVFNLPAGASVSRFAMYTTHTELVEGELIDRTRAANIYQSIVNRRRDPAILEQIGDNLFKMRVFPIFAQDTKRILLDFTLPIVEQEGGNYKFELPLMSDLEPVWDFAITGAIRGPNVAGSASNLRRTRTCMFDRRKMAV